ncbi:dihydropteroate synthase [Clostridium sp. SY8519]|jgi:hypothetical protein|uniref:fibronectin type III domain-containing protein n=1 Tax=Clostridium sp. (strain SY8519) TaxID=1042156 RepID=UPI0002172169|nr:fibronectin type III domain-containing protein [Clostridium sp. SY8519]BAK47413.1 dihydropteroate synthase [Clostridium sp. SY8519]
MRENRMKRIRRCGMAAALSAAVACSAAAPAFAAGNDFGDAQLMQKGKTYTGTLKEMEGAQYYRFKTDSTKGMKYRLTGSNSRSNAPAGAWALSVQIWDKANSESVKVFHANKNGSNYVTLSDLKPSKTYYVIVQSEGGTRNYYNEKYAIRYTASAVKPSTGKIRSLKSGSRKLTVTYRKASYGERYQISYKKKGTSSWKTVQNGKKLTKTISHLKKGKKYYVRVRAQRKVSGVWYSGKWSAVKSVKVR